MNEAQSDFIFITDVDLVPMPNAYEILQNYTRRGMPHKNEVKIKTHATRDFHYANRKDISA